MIVVIVDDLVVVVVGVGVVMGIVVGNGRRRNDLGLGSVIRERK